MTNLINSSFKKWATLAVVCVSALLLLVISSLADKRDHLNPEQLKHIELTILFCIFCLLALIVVTLYFLFSASLKPFKQLVSEIEQIRHHQQNQIQGSYPPELRETVDAFNRLLYQSRLQEKRYVDAMADLAHGLKTRIAAASLQLQQGGNQQSMALEQLNAMDNVVHYQLKRATIGPKGIEHHQTRLTDVLDSLIPLFDKLYQEKAIQVHCYFDKDIQLPVEEDDLTELLGNILENNFRYAQTSISVESKSISSGYLLRIDNDGPTLDPVRAESLFKRGIRADQINPGTGLGLSICREMVQSYRGDIWFSDRKQGVSLNLFFPCNTNIYQ